MPTVERAVPVLFVHDAERSVDWYTRVLGFRVLFNYGEYAGMALGDAQVHLAQRSPPEGLRLKGAFYLRLASGIDDYVADVVAKGGAASSPKDHDYGMRESTVNDPDGHDIYIGQPLSRGGQVGRAPPDRLVRTIQPFSGGRTSEGSD
jgi:catechol 2,3-dioxygenase-like lactoylglutathione lyase family enzyme